MTHHQTIETDDRIGWNTAFSEAEVAGTFRPARGAARALFLAASANGKWYVSSAWNEDLWPVFMGTHGPSVVAAATKWHVEQQSQVSTTIQT